MSPKQNILPLCPRPVISRDDITVPLASLGAPTVMARPLATRKTRRDFVDARRVASAAEAISALTRDNELFGFTKGQFSLLDILKAMFAKTGPAHMTLSTWTAARAEIAEIAAMRDAGTILDARWLVDISMMRTDKGILHTISTLFGRDSIRVTKNHSKFAILRAEGWDLVLWSSMNLNMNPRMENFWLGNDPELAGFFRRFLDEIWGRQRYDPSRATGEYQKDFTDGRI